MRQQSFRSRKLLDDRSEPSETGSRYFLHGDAFHKISRGQAAARASKAACRQHMVRAGCIIAKGLRAPIAEENTPGAIEAVSVFDRCAGQAQVFRREAINEPDSVREAAGNEDRAVFRERAPRGVGLGKLR